MSHHWVAMCFSVVALTACQSPAEPASILAAALRVTVTDVRVVQSGSGNLARRGITLQSRLENTARDSLQFSQCGRFLQVRSELLSWQSASGPWCDYSGYMQWKALAPGAAFVDTLTYVGGSPRSLLPFPWPVDGLSGNVSGTYRIGVIVMGGRVGHDLYAYSDPFVVVDTSGR